MHCSSFNSVAYLVLLLALLTIGEARYVHHKKERWLEYSTEVGYFLQDLNSTNTTAFDYITENFGLINQTYKDEVRPKASQWVRFGDELHRLNSHSGKDVSYKVFFLARHGEGYHNVAETYYGTPAWNCYWSLIDGNGTVTWVDAKLTPNGIMQAQAANTAFKGIIKDGAQIPNRFYSSPLSRAASTLNITWLDITGLGEGKCDTDPLHPIFIEKFRESLDGHTCDHRNTRTYLHHTYPEFVFEPGFTKYDELFTLALGESTNHETERAREALDEVFYGKDGVATTGDWISVTAHSGILGSVLTAVKHRDWSLQTGGVIPVVVKAEWTLVNQTVSPVEPSVPAPVCTSNPTSTPTSLRRLQYQKSLRSSVH